MGNGQEEAGGNSTFSLSHQSLLNRTSSPLRDNSVLLQDQQQQLYRDYALVARQQQMHQQQRQQRDPRQDPVYFQTMLALRQRDLMLAANEAQVRRFLALKSSGAIGAAAGTNTTTQGLAGTSNHGSGLFPSSALLSRTVGGRSSSISSQASSLSGFVGLNSRHDPSFHFLPETLLATSARMAGSNSSNHNQTSQRS